MSLPPRPRQRGKPVDIQTERFQLRSLRTGDIGERWMSWAADPDVTLPMNALPRRPGRAELESYIARFDNTSGFGIGIFTRPEKLFIGFYMIGIDQLQRTANFNVMIGDKDYWGKGVVNETRAALLDFLFRYKGVEKATGHPLARNFPAVFNYKAQGWHLEGVLRGQARSPADGSRLDQYQFGMLASEWPAVKERLASR